MSGTVKRLLHLPSAVIGGQLVSLAMRGQAQPEDTLTNLILQQMETHGLVRSTVDLTPTNLKAQNAAEIRRCYALKIMECLLVRGSDIGLMTEASLEDLMRKAWRMARVMEEEDHVGQQLASLSPPAPAEGG